MKNDVVTPLHLLCGLILLPGFIQILNQSALAHSLSVSLTINVLTVTWCVMKNGIVIKERMRSTVVSLKFPFHKHHCVTNTCLQVSMNVILVIIVHTFVRTTLHLTSADVRLA